MILSKFEFELSAVKLQSALRKKILERRDFKGKSSHVTIQTANSTQLHKKKSENTEHGEHGHTGEKDHKSTFMRTYTDWIFVMGTDWVSLIKKLQRRIYTG